MNLTYPEAGATAASELPPGYSYVRERMHIGRGVFAEATEHLMTWRMYRAVGVTVRTGHPRVTEGTDVMVVLGAGPIAIHAPCRIIWTLAEDRPGQKRAGFAYGTLEGHPESGEESFVVEEDAAEDGPSEDERGDTWLTITSFSRPVAWYARLGGPLTRMFQRAFVRRCGTVMRRLCAPDGFTYPEVGATRGGQLPRGYHHIVERMYVGRGVLPQATEHLMTWQMFREAGVEVRASAAHADVDVDVTMMLPLPLVPLRIAAPNRIVWMAQEDRRRGFAFGTLPGHPGSGEAAFVLTEDDNGDTWLTVRSFSRLRAWYARLGTPVSRWQQRRTSRRYGPALRRLCGR